MQVSDSLSIEADDATSASWPTKTRPSRSLARDALRLPGFVAVQVQMEEASH